MREESREEDAPDALASLLSASARPIGLSASTKPISTHVSSTALSVSAWPTARTLSASPKLIRPYRPGPGRQAPVGIRETEAAIFLQLCRIMLYLWIFLKKMYY